MPRHSRRRALPVVCGALILGAGTALAGAQGAQAASTQVGTLAFTPATGLDKSPISAATKSSGSPKGCPSPSTNVTGTAVGPGKWSSGIQVITNSSSGVSTSSDFTVDFADTMYGIGQSNSAPITAGRYDVTLKCQDKFGSNVYGTFVGSLWFTDATHYQTTDPAAAGPTPTSSVSPTSTATPSATATSSAAATSSATATPSPSSSVGTPTPAASGTPTSTPSRSPGASGSPAAGGSASPTTQPSASLTASLAPLPGQSGQPSSAATASPAPVTIEALDASGQPLSPMPTLLPGDKITVMTNGFGAGERVAVTLHSAVQSLGTTQADAQGLVAFDFVVPKSLPAGQHTLTFKGASHTSAFGFLVAPADGSTGGPSATGASGDSPQLPKTGVDPGSLLLLALTLLGFGVGLAVLGRRSRLLAARHRPRHAYGR